MKSSFSIAGPFVFSALWLRAVESSPVTSASSLHARNTCSTYTANTTYVGCYTDSGNPHTLYGAQINRPNYDTPQECADICGNAGYIYAGVELG